MSDLASKKCIPCEGGVEPLKLNQAEEYLKQINRGWKIVEGKRIEREFKFKNFKEALEFVNKVGEIAEAEGHHPVVEFSWGWVRLKLWTHAIGGLFDNDFILAAKIDRISGS